MEHSRFKYEGGKLNFSTLCDFVKHDKRCSTGSFDIIKFSLAESAVFMIELDGEHYRLVGKPKKLKAKKEEGHIFLHDDGCFIPGIAKKNGNLVFDLTFEYDSVSKFSDDKWDDLNTIANLIISPNGKMELIPDSDANMKLNPRLESKTVKSIELLKPHISLKTWQSLILNPVDHIWKNFKDFLSIEKINVSIEGRDIEFQLEHEYDLMCSEYRKRSSTMAECDNYMKGCKADLYRIDTRIDYEDGFQLVHMPLRLICLRSIQGHPWYIVKEVVFTGREFHGFDYYARKNDGYVLLEYNKNV
jgi:hypothetical protein